MATAVKTAHFPSTGNAAADDFVLYPFLHSFSRKQGDFIDFQAALNPLLSASVNTTVAVEFAGRLNEYRHLTMLLLESEESDSAALDDTLRQYVGYLYGLINSSAALSDRTSLDSKRPSFEEAPFLGLFGNCKLRTAIRFTWEDCLLAHNAHSTADALFELASVLIAGAVWKLRKAAAFTKQPVTTFHAVEMYRYIREAAGFLQAVHRDVMPVLGPSVSADCNLQLLACLVDMALADAQGVTVLRAIKKGNAATLIAGLAADTAALFENAAKRLDSCAVLYEGAADKLSLYLKYKQKSFESYHYSFASQVRLEAHEGGAAVRCAQEALAMYNASLELATQYDAADPPTNAQLHRDFDTELQAVVSAATERAEKDNKRAYMQAIPQQLPTTPEPKRLVTTMPFLWPIPPALILDNKLDRMFLEPVTKIHAVRAKDDVGAPAIVVTGIDDKTKQLDDKNKESVLVEEKDTPKEAQSSLLRWLLILIAAPMLFIISLISVVVWIVLLPVKIICCPVGCLAQIAWDIFEYAVKAPFRGMLWASGKPWRPDVSSRPKDPADVENQVKA